MVTKVYGNGDGTGVNDTHVEIPPIILVHNKTPFEDYSAAVSAVEQKTINPGEIIIAYYKNPATADGLSAIIAVGPLTQGGKNDIFKNAEEIDALVEYVSTLISGQQSSFDDLCEQLRQEIASEIEATKQSLIAENASIIDAAMQYMAVKFDTSFGQFVEIVNNHIDGSINDIQTFVVNHVSTLNRELNELHNETNEKINTIDTHIDSSYNDLKVLIGQSISSSDSSCKAYVDEKNAEQDVRFRTKIDEMNVSIMNISTMADARIDAIELALDNEIEDCREDLSRQITNLTASLTDYADAVRRDSSAYTKQLDLEQKDYIDNKIYELRTEKNNDIADLSDTMRAYTDGSVNRMKNIIDGEIAQAVTGVNTRMDSSLAALKTYTDLKNEELRGELEDAYEAADNALYNRLNNKIDQNVDEFDASLAALGAALRSEITNGDASVLVAARAMSNDTSAKAKSDNDELEAELKADIRDLSTDVRREFNSSIAYIDNKQTEYTDTQIQNVSTSLNQKIDNMKTTIEQHIDSSITVLTQTVNLMISHSDASLNEKIDSLDGEVSTLREETTTKIDELDASLTNYINSSVVVSINDLSTRTSQSIETIQNELTDGLAAVAMNASTDNKTLKEEIESHLDASWVEMNASVFNLVAVVDEELRVEFNSSIASVLATSRQENTALESEINDHIDASVAEINQKEAHDVQTINVHIDASIAELKNHSDSEDAAIRLEFSDADASLKTEVEEEIALAKANVEEQLTDKFNALDSSLENAVAQLRTEIAEGDASVVTYVTSVEAAITQKFASVEEDMATADASVLAAAKDYADVIEDHDVARVQTLREDVSTIQAGIAEKFAEDENQHTLDISILNAKIDSSVTAVYNVLEQQISAHAELVDERIAGINEHIDSSVAELSNVIATLKSDTTEADAALDSKIDALDTEVNAQIESLEQLIADIDASSGGDITNERRARIAKDEEIDASIENIKINASDLADYVDASLNSLRAELQGFAEDKDAEQYNLISGIVVQMFEDLDASVNSRFDETASNIDELRNDVSAAFEHTASEIDGLRNDVSAAIADTADDIESLRNDVSAADDAINTRIDNLVDAVEVLDASTVEEIANLKEHLESEIGDLTTTVKDINSHIDSSYIEVEGFIGDTNVALAELSGTVEDLDASVASRLDNHEARIVALEEESVDISTRLAEEVSDLNDKHNVLVNDISAYLEEVEQSFSIITTDVQTLAADTIAAIDELETVDASIAEKLDTHIRYTGYKFDDNEVEHAALWTSIDALEVSLGSLRNELDAFEDETVANFTVVSESINENANDIYTLNQRVESVAYDVSSLEEQYNEDVTIIANSIGAIENSYLTNITKERTEEQQYFDTYVITQRCGDDYTDVSISLPSDEFYVQFSNLENVMAAAVVDLNNKINALDSSVDNFADYVNAVDASLEGRISELENKQTVDASEFNTKIDALSEYVEVMDGQLTNAIGQVDSSVQQLFDMVYAIYNKLGIDKVIEPSTNILPAMIEEIKRISDEELDWRTLGDEPEPGPDYDDGWRELDDGSEKQNNNILHSTITRTVSSDSNEAYEDTWREIH